MRNNHFLKYECESYLKQPPLTPPQRKGIVACCTSDHRLAIGTGWWSTVPISRDNRFLPPLLLRCSWKRGMPCYSVRFSCSPSSTDRIYTTKFDLHWQIYQLNLDWGANFSRFSHDIENANMLTFWKEWLGLPNCVDYWSRMVSFKLFMFMFMETWLHACQSSGMTQGGCHTVPEFKHARKPIILLWKWKVHVCQFCN